MKHYGNIDVQQNLIQQMALEAETDFPTQPVVGRIIFKNKIVYICVEIASGIPVWVPLTRELNAYIHNQAALATTWSINHGLKSGTVSVQAFDLNGYMVIPNEIQILDRDNVAISFGVGQQGRAIVMAGDLTGNTKPTYAFEYYQTNPATTWSINHALGYNPIVRVFIGNQEVQPQSISFPDVNNVVITFSTPQVGMVKMI